MMVVSLGWLFEESVSLRPRIQEPPGEVAGAVKKVAQAVMVQPGRPDAAQSGRLRHFHFPAVTSTQRKPVSDERRRGRAMSPPFASVQLPEGVDHEPPAETVSGAASSSLAAGGSVTHSAAFPARW